MMPTRTELLKRARAVLKSGAVKPPSAETYQGDGDFISIAAEFLDISSRSAGWNGIIVLDIDGIGRMAAGRRVI
jgi:hypothetical protein